MVDVLITNALVLTCEPNAASGRIIERGFVAIADGNIYALGSMEEYSKDDWSATETIDATGKIVMPGFIVTHTHMSYVLGHNMPVDFSKLHDFWDMLQKMGWEWLEDIMTHDGIYAATRYAATKMLRSGVTTVCELVEGPNVVEGILDASRRAVEESGIRAQIGFEVTERVPGKHILTNTLLENAERGFEENLRFLRAYPPGNGGRIEGRLGVHTAFTNSFKTLEKARQIANDMHCGIEIHVAEIPRAFVIEKHGMSAPEVLETTGLLGSDVIAAHCIDLTDGDIEILRRNEVNVAHTPMTNSFGGNGVARIPYMLEQGMNITLGHDCFFTLDIAEYLRYAFLLHKAHHANAGILPITQVLDMVLGNAAKAMGLSSDIGSLKVGKKADLIVIAPDSPSPVNKDSVLSYFYMSFQGRDVETVFVDGKKVIEGGRSNMLDEVEVRDRCQEEAASLWRKAGVQI